MENFNVSYSIEEFRNLSKDELKARLTDNHRAHYNSLESTQIGAWDKEYSDLHSILQTANWSGQILFEYSIPGLPKKIDVVLLIHSIIFVIEYKVGAKEYETSAIRQVNGYALRLKFFHSNSNDNWIVPILVATEGAEKPINVKRSEEDMVYEPITCNSSKLKEVLNEVLKNIGTKKDKNWEKEWEKGVFKASPTIIDAARDVWRSNNVKGFQGGEATEKKRLKAAEYIEKTIIEETKKRNDGHRKSICFVTGVPGAGKTLVGLNVSVALQKEGASMLSGNGPLVKVLTATLKQDIKKYKDDQLKHSRNEISVESIIRDAYGYKKEIFEKRLHYNKSNGKVSLKDKAELSSQHVIIFDEAQRAWDKAKMIKPGHSGKKDWQDEKFPFSEPGLLLWDMNQCDDWGVFVCLVGGGQEIHTGEAGICEWLRTLNETKDLKDWHIYMSNELKGDLYNSKSYKTIEEYIRLFENEKRITIAPELHLTASQRSNRTEKVSQFVEELLNGNISDCKKIYKEIKGKYQIYLTRDLEKAKTKMRERKKQILDKGYVDGKSDEEVRMGMLMSSRAARMRPLGYEIKKESQYKDKVANWFLDSEDSVISSDFLEIALNEFFVQGLELDISTVMWDADFRYNQKDNEWKFFEFNDKYWSEVDKKKQEQKCTYMKNAYRVLLTRARTSMVIFVPEASSTDDTRSQEMYNGTYNYLELIGFEVLK